MYREYDEEVHSKELSFIHTKEELTKFEKSDEFDYFHSDMITKIYDLIERGILEYKKCGEECVIDLISSHPEIGTIEFETVNYRVFKLTIEQI